ncbi:MAG: DNA translocase FtsK 4TM domain-containing protein [Elusimicrobia bacterium]|jgi:S-DNA-T family DNA segregation ATPase FtsK/SpoIIIE|nr:DNA translocase FtsK 4TM domain-containing protein [Elusimicrobiota bacterium]
MSSFFARYRSSSRTRKKTTSPFPAAGVFLLSLSAVAFYCVLFPSGLWGKPIKGFLATAFGFGRYFFPLLSGYVGLRLALSRPWAHGFLRTTLWLSLFTFGVSFVSLFSQVAYHVNAGGVLGLAGSAFLERLFGTAGAWLVTLLGSGLTVAALARVSPVHVAERLVARLRSDWNEWKSARLEVRTPRGSVVKPRPLVTETTPAPRSTPAVVQSVPSRAVFVEEPKPPSKNFSRPPVEPRPSTSQSESLGDAPAPAPYRLPPLDLLSDPPHRTVNLSESELVEKSRVLEQTLANFGVEARTTDIHPGPVITRFDLEPAPGVKISSIVNLSNDIALAMKATRVRVLAPIPGKGAVGVEIPNPEMVTVTLKEILADSRFQSSTSPLSVVLGKTSSGEPSVTDLAPMPHLLVAGATGTGKSVCVHTLIVSILMRAHPDRVKFVLIDPKRLELPMYEGMPHLYDPRSGPDEAQVITQPKEAAKALARMVKVMEFRYELFAKANVRNIEGYNEKRVAQGLPPEYYIVVIIDELADLMLISARDVEDCIQRLAQMARAVGIHLVLATQRPSVDVITGVIKANLPARIALRVASQTDSRVILDTPGAESLVGRGDMLFLPAGAPAPIRLQGAFVSEKEVEAVVSFVKGQGGPRYVDIFAEIAASQAANEDVETRQELDQALRLIIERRRVSQDLLKSHFGSSSRASNVLSLLEVKGYIRKPEGTNKWDINFDKIEDLFRTGNSSVSTGSSRSEVV